MSEKTEKPRGRPRREDADDAILAAAAMLLREGGYRGFTVDTVARRTGIAKTTIYRRWPDKASLALAVVDAAVPAAHEDLRGLLEEITSAMDLIGSGDPDGVALVLPFATRRLAAIRAALGTSGSAAADALVGALLVRFVDGRHSPADGAVDDLLRIVPITG